MSSRNGKALMVGDRDMFVMGNREVLINVEGFQLMIKPYNVNSLQKLKGLTLWDLIA